MLFCHQTLARNDDALLLCFSWMMAVDKLEAVGPSACYLFSFLLKGNKVGKVGQGGIALQNKLVAY